MQIKNKLSRDERQDHGIDLWKQAKGRGTCLYPTGFGKTRTALKVATRLIKIKSDAEVVVVVPNEVLQTQWITELAKVGIVERIKVVIINTAIKNTYECTLLIVDEVHMMVADTFKEVFQRVDYQMLLCLTGTLDRLDGKQVLLDAYAPVCDKITLDDAIANGWVADFKQYKVFIDVDTSEYDKQHTKFTHHFAFFNYDFPLAMSCIDKHNGVRNKQKLAAQLKCELKDVTLHTMGFIKAMKARKAFIYDHPAKIDIANKILNARTEKKIITFTKSVAHAKLLCCGDIYHGKITKAKKQKLMDEFNEKEVGILNSCQALNVGADVKGVNTIIVISGDSSSITKRQRIGRSIRKEEDKVAEVWQLVLRGTVEEEWYRKSNTGLKTVTLDEEQLDTFLKDGTIKDIKHKEQTFLFRF